jgi:Asp-tRNA(Asn)/Glu-tRNA(Gln) amidotransferase A subunit family amidase
MEYSRMSAPELARAVKRGALIATDIVKATIEHIVRRNPGINALTHVTYEQAQAEAQANDHLRSSRAVLSPLAGVPYEVKNIFNL